MCVCVCIHSDLSMLIKDDNCTRIMGPGYQIGFSYFYQTKVIQYIVIRFSAGYIQ